MKRLYTLATVILFIVLPESAHCQRYVDNDEVAEVKSLLNRENDLSGFGSIDFKITELVDSRAMILGARAGLVVNRRFLFGLAGYGIATNLEFDGNPDSGQIRPLQLYGGYAGMLLGGMIAPQKMIHFSFPVLLGAGGVEVSDENFFPRPSDSDYSIERSAFFVIEPGVELEINVTRVLRLAVGGSYRWVSGSDLSTLSDNDLTNWAGNFAIRFGGF
ncbi:MAG: hypothetical protein AAGC88_01665 [Bacteroidota bacterium]